MQLLRVLAAAAAFSFLPSQAAPFPEPGFGSGGMVIGDAPFGSSLAFNAALDGLVVDESGRILYAVRRDCGVRTPFIGCASLSVERRLPDGAADLSFGVRRSGGFHLALIETGYPASVALAIDKEKRIVTAHVHYSPYVLLTRWFDDGTMDTSFGTHRPDPSYSAASVGFEDPVPRVSMAIDSDGRILVALGSHKPGTPPDERNITLARLLPDGTVDTTFGPSGDGKVFVHIPGGVKYAIASSMALRPDGRIVLAGYTRLPSGAFAAVVTQHLPDGGLDLGFGIGGIAVAPLPGYDAYGRSLVLQADGGVLVAATLHGPAMSSGLEGLLRLKESGAIDGTYGPDGWRAVALRGNFGAVSGMALMPDGRAVVVGHGDYLKGPGSLTALALLHKPESGALDPAWNGDGRHAITAPGYAGGEAMSVAVDAAGHVIVTGTIGPGPGSRFFVTKLVPW